MTLKIVWITGWKIKKPEKGYYYPVAFVKDILKEDKLNIRLEQEEKRK